MTLDGIFYNMDSWLNQLHWSWEFDSTWDHMKCNEPDCEWTHSGILEDCLAAHKLHRLEIKLAVLDIYRGTILDEKNQDTNAVLDRIMKLHKGA